MRFGRRNFLFGASGSVLALPLFSSLVRGQAGLAAVNNPLKRIIIVAQAHGRYAAHLIPEQAQLKYGRGDTSGFVNSGGLRAKAIPANPGDLAPAFGIDRLRNNAELRRQMMVVSGMMTAGESMHGHTDRVKTNFVTSGSQHAGRPTISIDHVLQKEIYGGFVPDQRAIYMGGDQDWGYFFTNESGENIDLTFSPRSAYESLVFPGANRRRTGASPAPTPAAGPQISMDRVLEQSLLNTLTEERRRLEANTRLSQADRELLANYLDNLNDLEKRLMQADAQAAQQMPMTIGEPLSCQPMDVSTVAQSVSRFTRDEATWDNAHALGDEYSRIMKLAFMCDVTRIGGLYFRGGMALTRNSARLVHRHSNGQYDEHQTIWHKMADSDPRYNELYMVTGDYIDITAKIAEDLASVKLGEQGSLLDETLVVYVSEFGTKSDTWSDGHGHTDYAYISFGGSNALKTGYFYDSVNGDRSRPIAEKAYTANHYLQTIMTAFGLTPQQWEGYTPGAGFGTFVSATQTRPFGNNTLPVYAANDSEKRLLLPILKERV